MKSNYKKKALITGINGQDGSYLAELLLSKDYEVHGIVRRQSFEASSLKLERLSRIVNKIFLHVGSINNHLSVYKIVSKIKPDECYHLAASSFVDYQFEDEVSVLENNFNSTHNILASLRGIVPKCRFYFAGSSEMFGDVENYPQQESTRFNPRSIYGISKVASHHLVLNYRKHYKMYACTGIMFNHESPRRGVEFVTRKISMQAAKIHLGLSDTIELGNIESQRDWGYAPEYVEAMWKMLNQSEPSDFVIASGKLTSVKVLVEEAFNYLNLDYQKYLVINKDYIRPTEKIPLVGNYSFANKRLGWHPKKDIFKIIKEMIDSDLKALKPQ